MARHESSEPVEIMDRLLWRDAQQMLDRHAQSGPDGRCEWCGWHWPCPPRRLAERAEVAASRPWRESSWTAAPDLHTTTLPSWGPDRPNPALEPSWQPEESGPALDLMPAMEEAPSRGAPARSRRNSGLFD
jgi:hypothetical protein